MSEPLNFVDHLLARGRNLQKVGREQDARRVLRRLVRLQDLPAKTAEETHILLAKIALNQRRYHRARRHLVAALRLQPENADYHYLLATAYDAEDTGDPQRAGRHYRRSLQLDPHQPQCLLDYGLFNLREGRTQAGIVCLRRAVELAPNDAEVVREAANGMMIAGHPEAERSLLRTALFRNGRDGRFRHMMNDSRFRELATQQELARKSVPIPREDEEPTILAFTCRDHDREPVRLGGRVFRHDGPAPTFLPHSSRPDDQWSEQRQVR